MDDLFSKVISFVLEPNFEGPFLIIRTLFIIASLVMIFGIILFLSLSNWLNLRYVLDAKALKDFRPDFAGKFVKQWAGIISRLEAKKESEWKLALIEADDLLDKVLKKMKFGGETLREKLEKAAPTALLNIEEIYEAQRVRNNVVADPDYKLNFKKAEYCLKIYEKALEALEAL